MTTEDEDLLNEITDELIADTKKIMNIDEHMTKIFKAVADNLSIIKWLKEHLKGKLSFGRGAL